jgi:hypothetical protein
MSQLPAQLFGLLGRVHHALNVLLPRLVFIRLDEFGTRIQQFP